MNNSHYLPKRPSLIKVMLISFLSCFTRGKTQPVNLRLNDFKNYKLVKRITKKNQFNNYQVAIYEKNKKKYFVKTLLGPARDLNYYKIVNEYYSASILSSKLQGNIRVPKIIEIYQHTGIISLVYEYIEGKDLLSESEEKKKKALLSIIAALQKIQLTDKEKMYFNNRNAFFFLITFPLMAFLSWKNNKSIRLLILKSFIKTWKFRPQNDTLVVSHRDLILENIIKKDGDLYVTDFEQIALSLRSFDISYISVVPELRSLRDILKKEIDSSGNLFLRIYILFQLSADPQNPETYMNIFKQELEGIYKTNLSGSM